MGDGYKLYMGDGYKTGVTCQTNEEEIDVRIVSITQNGYSVLDERMCRYTRIV